MYKKYFLPLFLLMLLTACSETSVEPEEAIQDVSNEESLSVIATFYPVYEMTQQVAGERLDVHQLISGGTDAHHFEPSARDVAMINDSDLFIYSSEEMETWVPSLLASLDNSDLPIVKTAENIELMEAEGHDEHDHHDHDDHGHEEDDHDHSHSVDPHIWLDPVLAQEQVDTIKEALIEIDPDGADYYTERAAEFNQELQILHEDYETAFAEADNRVFFTQHESFGYLAERYDLTQISVGGLSTEVEPSPSRIAEINQLVEEYDVPVIYYQDGASSSIAETIANETGTEVAVLYDLETLSSEMIDEGLDYLSAMRENLETLKKSIR
ncbi:zinc ABC transporter substrate-binding protein [Alkalibacterium iburiense]|uniref:Zinc ABC transporter substrate-binding protein n=1 Tax=Alkalibacterium iburiense TaxID=290589 RepID=A0ABP3HJ94_9LACT